jgi:hypothetical protein
LRSLGFGNHPKKMSNFKFEWAASITALSAAFVSVHNTLPSAHYIPYCPHGWSQKTQETTFSFALAILPLTQKDKVRQFGILF